MKINWSLIVNAAFLIVAIICACVAYHYYKQGVAEQQSKNLIVAAKNGFSVPLSKGIKDSTGAQHYQAPANQNTFTSTTIANKQSSVSLGAADTTAKILGIQSDQIIYWQQVAMMYKAQSLKAQKTIDTMGTIVRYYKDKFTSIAYHYPKNPMDTSDMGSFDFQHNTVLSQTEYFRKKFLWWKYSPVIDISAADTNETINGYKTLSITQTPVSLGFKAQLKSSYDFATGRLIPSVGAIISIGNWDISGRYYYNSSQNKFRPIVSAAYNFINIR